jgi:hypothetical protein
MKLPKNFNVKLVITSLIALGFIALTFFVNPYFIVGAIVFMLWGRKEMKTKGQ